jgi:hypothetical protein
MSEKNELIHIGQGRIINTNKIQWIQKHNDCYEICMKTNGCNVFTWLHTMKLCKEDNPRYFDYLDTLRK